MRWAGHVACMEERRGAQSVLVRRSEGKRSLVRPRHRWKYNIKMDLRDIKWGSWTGMIWFRIGTGSGRLCMR